MKLRAYKIAALAILATIAISTRAQQTPAQPAKPAAPAQTPTAATAPTINATGSFAYVVPDVSAITEGAYAALAPLQGYVAQGFTQDSTYRKKMRQLQEQMRVLQKQMSTLRTDEMKKNADAISKRMAERSRVYAENFKKFDQSFNGKFKNFGRGFNFEHNDAELDKKVQSGDVKLKTKSYSKSYPVDRDDKLQINNQYGKVTVNTWNKNEIKVDVEIKAYANNDDEAQKLLDKVKINDSKDNSTIAFKTDIDENNRWGSWSVNGKGIVHKTVINYTVYMPVKSALTISNSYGGIVLPELSGKLDIRNSFGSVSAKALTNPDNVIIVKYGSADIENLVGSDLKVSFGSLNLQSADRLTADVRYSPAKIGTLSTSGAINIHYGDGLQIGNLGKNLKTLNVNSQYAPVKLSSLNNDNADFDVTVSYGGFSYNDDVVVVNTTPADDKRHWVSTKTYKGRIGKGNSDKVITIKTNYSSVKFDQ